MSRKFDWVDINFVKSNILKVIYEVMNASNAKNFLGLIILMLENPNQILLIV